MVIFLGSTLGNLPPERRVAFLRRVRSMLLPGDRFLLGVDLVKDVEVLEAAYNDSRGLSAEFALNLIDVLNRELDGDLPRDAFRYVAFFDREHSWIDMRLVAAREVRARLAAIDLDVRFEEGEALRTEVSCKFTREGIERTLREAGLELLRWDTDESEWFGLALAEPAGA
jgi:L-histidine N-alpha-methyltransferase